jgi:hypothetical protein
MEANNDDFSPSQPGGESKSGPFLAKVVSHLDPSYMGTLEVTILRPVGNTASEGQLHHVSYMSPFYGVTGIDHVGADPNDYNNTQKSYGMWMIPPDPGSVVVVFFIDGDPRRGYWIGCVPDENMNFMVPGLAAAESVVDGKSIDGQTVRYPAAEYNKKINGSAKDPTQLKKPKHPIAEAIEAQGLLLDDTRGITTSSARRDTPSMVFGISTPGPIDKRSGAKQGAIGKKEHRIPNAFVSRLGGTTFVMDDGDDKFLRKGSPATTAPEYAAIEQGEKAPADPTRLHNELFRIRTRTGHQILLHNSEDLIYIGNSRGTAWVELTSNGKIDIFSEDSISVHTNQDFNFYAGRDINFEAVRNINMRANQELQIETVTDMNLVIGREGRITTKQNLNVKTTQSNFFSAGQTTEIKSGGNHIETAAKIHMNGPAAKEAVPVTPLVSHILPTTVDKQTIRSIMRRIPTHEPYPQHENLQPADYTPEKTNRDLDGRTITGDESKDNDTLKAPATVWKKYATKTDTFAKVKGEEKKS